MVPVFIDSAYAVGYARRATAVSKGAGSLERTSVAISASLSSLDMPPPPPAAEEEEAVLWVIRMDWKRVNVSLKSPWGVLGQYI